MKKISNQPPIFLFAATLLLCLLLPASLCLAQAEKQKQVYSREAKETLTPIEMDWGDTFKFKLRNGQERTLVLEKTAANILLTNLKTVKQKEPTGGTLYHFTCEVTIDGQPMTMERYVCSQESFYEPYVVNGMRIWFDGVQDIFEFVNENHGECRPKKQARFAISDLTDRISPVELKAWYPNDRNFIDIADTYNGDDCWMGPYQGADAHGGLDINQPKGTPNFVPIDIDDHFLFHSLAKGDNNNRWRGLHTWPNGDVWTLQNHHILHLHVPEHTPIKAGSRLVDAAGVRVGDHNHSHYIFKSTTPENKQEVLLDPWIIFWQTFEDNKKRAGAIKAAMRPVGPAAPGKPVAFSSEGSRPGPSGQTLSYYWTFGDGGWSGEQHPTHTFAQAGVYPVTLTVEDGAERAAFTQHITVSGEAVKVPALALAAPDEVTFRARPVQEMDVYGKQVRGLPHTLHFLARPSRPVPNAKVIQLKNLGGGTLRAASAPQIRYLKGENWLVLKPEGKGNGQRLSVSVNAANLVPGTYFALVTVACPKALNEKQGFLVELVVPTYPPAHSSTRDLVQEVVDDADHTFYSTPYFWVGHRFKKWPEKGFRSFYLTNGGRAKAGEFARFTPDLAAGEHEVSFHADTPFPPGTRFAVRVRHKTGEQVVWVEPAKSRVVGTFDFDEGTDGFVEVQAEGANGQVLLDAVVFKRVKVDAQTR